MATRCNTIHNAFTPDRGYDESMKSPSTQTRLSNLIKSDVDAGRKVEWLEIDAKDRASLVEEIRRANTPLAKSMKKIGINAALPTLEGVQLRWDSPTTRTKLKT
jgi:hypothetical protein